MNGVVKRDSFKVVYVAPMKALAAEMTANFGKRLAPLGITESIFDSMHLAYNESIGEAVTASGDHSTYFAKYDDDDEV